MFPSYLEVEKKGSQQLFGERKKIFQKNWFTASRSTKKMFPTVAAIWREKKVDPCYLETK